MSVRHRKSIFGDFCAKSVRLILKPYADYLNSQGFSARRHRRYVRAVEHFGRWIGRRKICKPRVQEFLDEGLGHCQCLGVSHDRRMVRAALNHLLTMLGVEQQQRPEFQGRLGRVLRRYEEHLTNTRGLAHETILRHLKYTQDMLHRFDTRRETQFRQWTPQMIEEDVAREGYSKPGRGRIVGWCARSFLRFLLQEGLIEGDLAAAVPTVARWRLAALPTTLSEAEIEQLHEAADRQTPVGRRDYAIVLCLSELGLRGADVAKLQIDDIDFTSGTLRLNRRKERQSDVFPMTPNLRSALKTWLRNGRPICQSKALFIRLHAPIGQQLSSGGIRRVIVRLATEAGLRHRVRGPHDLRRSLASRMINSGVTLKQIADFLGHTSIDTTTLYAKVDLTTLSRVALPWPTMDRKGVRS